MVYMEEIGLEQISEESVGVRRRGVDGVATVAGSMSEERCCNVSVDLIMLSCPHRNVVLSFVLRCGVT